MGLNKEKSNTSSRRDFLVRGLKIGAGLLLADALMLVAPLTASADSSNALLTAPKSKSFQFQAGISLQGYGNPQNYKDYISPLIDRAVADNANYISANVPIFQKDYRSTDIYTDPDQTLADDNIKILAKVAHDKGLAVNLKILLDGQSITAANPDKWVGNLEPSDLSAWFASMKKNNLHFAQVAQDAQIESLTIGNENSSLERYSDSWRDIINADRQVYKGLISYSFNHDASDFTDFGGSLDYIGIDNYYPAKDLPDGASVDNLVSSWQPFINKIRDIAKKYNTPIIFGEWGLTSTKGAYREPWAWQPTGDADQETQRRYIEAFRKAYFDSGLIEGSFWWRYQNQNPDYDPASDKGNDLLGKSGEGELSKFYSAYKGKTFKR